MQPKDLKFPYRWNERRPLIHDRVLFIPDYYTQHREWTFPSWDEIFQNSHPVVVEYCAGNGAWIVEKAKANPEVNWVAVEWRFDRARKIWSKMKNFSLPNLFIVCGEAQVFTSDYVTSFDAAYINFPDPWPKEKHAKHRLFQSPFIENLARTVKSHVTIVTDDPPYAAQIVSEMSKYFNPAFPDPFYITEWPDYGTSYFDALWREKGRTLHYFKYETTRPS
jgi:tRNA (guanine-N7-)-methyltransferase